MRAALCALAIVVIAVWEIAVLARVHSSAATDEDWQRAARWVREQRRPGDLIVFAPAWVDPIGRRWLGDLIAVADAARMDDARYGRVFEVSIRGARAPEGRGTRIAELLDGRVQARLYQRPAARVTWDLGDRAALREVDFTPRRCVPLRPDARLEVDATLGSSLVVYAGVADFRSRRANHSVALLRVLVDGTEVARALVGNDSGWLPLPVVTTSAGPHTVIFDATSSGDKSSLDLCLFAEARQ